MEINWNNNKDRTCDHSAQTCVSPLGSYENVRKREHCAWCLDVAALHFRTHSVNLNTSCPRRCGSAARARHPSPHRPGDETTNPGRARSRQLIHCIRARAEEEAAAAAATAGESDFANGETLTKNDSKPHKLQVNYFLEHASIVTCHFCRILDFLHAGVGVFKKLSRAFWDAAASMLRAS